MLERAHAWLLLTLAACGPLPTQSAYSQQRDICGDDTELFAPMLEDCRARWQSDRSCAGLLGLSGEIEGVYVIVESELVIARFDQLETLSGTIVRDAVSLTGRSPYFEYSLAFRHIGGGIDDANAPSRSLTIGGPEDVYDDARVGAGLRLSDGAESDELLGVTGELHVALQSVDEQAGTFIVELETGDVIGGCFHALVTESVLTQESDDAP